MSAGGFLFMLVSVGFVVGLTALCFWWVVRTPDPGNGA